MQKETKHVEPATVLYFQGQRTYLYLMVTWLALLSVLKQTFRNLQPVLRLHRRHGALEDEVVDV
jgi:hypothetical protein